ncbi:BsuPI-related putative proteinase inhibitor [Halomicrococcus sp. NG-SE-24]|uniref:BsuPI-related putative proteinase inhibitor n=1 Tax=Halomicrococcus sp. NG-SE-24 TaxID=3436928 RepID=UPI003D9807AE
MTLETDVTATPRGDAVAFELTVRNAGDDPVELTFRSGLTADFAVLDDDEERWRASEGRMFTQALQSETVESGGERTYRGEWSEPEPGEYTVVATLNTVDDRGEARTDFSV